jgi:hypothetical protein
MTGTTEKPEVSELDMKLYAGIEVVRSQQSEITRRLGKLEERIEKFMVDPARVEDLESWRVEVEAPTPWKAYVMQAMMWGVGITILAAVGRLVGVEVAW